MRAVITPGRKIRTGRVVSSAGNLVDVQFPDGQIWRSVQSVASNPAVGSVVIIEMRPSGVPLAVSSTEGISTGGASYSDLTSRLHDIVGSDHYVIGAANKLVGLVSTNRLGLLSLIAGAGISVSGLTVGLSGNKILLFDSGGSIVSEYAATGTGLDLASAAATSGDVIWLPATVITGNHTLIAGVHYVGVSRQATILSGQITGASGCSLEQCSIARTADDGNDLIGVVGCSSTVFWLISCTVTSVQSGAGNSYAVSQTAAGTINIVSCHLTGNSVGGDGYATYRAGSGNIYGEGGWWVGSTAPCNE